MVVASRLSRKKLRFRIHEVAFSARNKKTPPPERKFGRSHHSKPNLTYNQRVGVAQEASGANKPHNQSRTGMQNNAGQKIRLRRNVSKQAVIQQNLSHMEQRAQKKKMAQEYYYKNKMGRSPMRRGDFNVEDKPPVHNRLGNKIRLRRTTNFQTNAIPQAQVGKRVLQRVRQQQPLLLKRPLSGVYTEKVMRVYSAQNRLSSIQNRPSPAQNRLMRIRQGAAFVQKSIVQRGNNLYRGAAQRAAMFHQPGLVNQRIRLRRNRPQPGGGAVNYTVQVANSAAPKNSKHHVGAQLNPTLQEEIRMLQNKSVPQNVISNEAVHLVGTGVTAKSLHERFSEL